MELQDLIREYHKACREADQLPKESPQHRDACERRRRLARELDGTLKDEA